MEAPQLGNAKKNHCDSREQGKSQAKQRETHRRLNLIIYEGLLMRD